jgi:hypothetical protein
MPANELEVAAAQQYNEAAAAGARQNALVPESHPRCLLRSISAPDRRCAALE